MFFKKKNKSNEKYRFNFEKYPELLEKYEVYRRLRLEITKYSMKDTNIAGKKLLDANKKFEGYSQNIFAKEIYYIFNSIKPILHKRRGEEGFFKWEEIFGKPFEELNEKERKCLVGLVDGNFIYELPEKYYNY